MYLIPITILSIYSVYLNNTLFNYTIVIDNMYPTDNIEQENIDIYNLIKIM
jgi:hypothetical protein